MGNLNNEPVKIDTSLDTVIIRNYIAGYHGGRTLDTEGFKPTVIPAGHVVIREKKGEKKFKPMPLNGAGTEYAALPADHEIVGIVSVSQLTAKPFCPIMRQGSVNDGAVEVKYTPAIIKALPLIDFYAD